MRQRGVWKWLGDPVVPPSLVELIEARLGTLRAPVSDIIDVLAVGEPMDLAALTRITGAAAVEDADDPGSFCAGTGPQDVRRSPGLSASAVWRGTAEARGAYAATSTARARRD